MKEVINHYDNLIDENNDPVRDVQELKDYMDKWDGQLFTDELQLSQEKSILEIGVGSGRIAVKVCGLCKIFTGIDISSKTIERASENLKEFNNVNLVCGDFLTCDFNEKFDVIYSTLTFMHIQDKHAAMKNVMNLLDDKGRFVLSIDKNNNDIIDYGTRIIKIYPDSVENITNCIDKTGLSIIKQFETEFAHIFVSVKEDTE